MVEGRDSAPGQPVLVRVAGEPDRATPAAVASWGGGLARRTSSRITTAGAGAGERDPARERHLTRLVAAGTHDVRVLTERVDRAVAAGDRDRTYAAIVDAFVALGDRGRSMRQRLLWSGRSVIGTERYDALRPYLDRALTARDPLPDVADTVRHHGVSGHIDLVQVSTGTPFGTGFVPPPSAIAPTYDPERHLSGAVARLVAAVESDRQIRRLSGEWGAFLLRPDGTIDAQVDPVLLDAACRAPFDESAHVITTGANVLVPAPDVGPIPHRARTWVDLAWELAVRCSRGRPLAGAEPDAHYIRVAAIDLDHLYPVVHGQRLVAALAKPSSVAEIVWLMDDEAAVNRFLAAGLAIGAVATVSGRGRTRPEPDA